VADDVAGLREAAACVDRDAQDERTHGMFSSNWSTTTSSTRQDAV
jgi:hypothetical protein